jgi:hypothetical protein
MQYSQAALIFCQAFRVVFGALCFMPFKVDHDLRWITAEGHDSPQENHTNIHEDACRNTKYPVFLEHQVDVGRYEGAAQHCFEIAMFFLPEVS